MRPSIPAGVSPCLAALFSLTHCGGGDASPPANSETGATNATGAGNSATSAGGSGSNGTDSSGSTGETASNVSGNNSSNAASGNSGTNASGSTTTTGADTTTTGNSSGNGSGGSASTTTGVGGDASTSTTGGDPDVDQNGKGNACPGDETSENRDYLKLGELRALNNRWGSTELGCSSASLRVFANQGSVGWDFSRGECGSGGQKPDFPEIEFGIHPFGIGNVNETSPPFSSTTLLPLQINQISSANVTVDNININLQSAQSWNISVEFWLSERHPVDDPNPGTYAEVIAFWGWQDGRWPCDTSGNVAAGSNSYDLCHQDDNWANGQWRYFQFRMAGGPSTNYNGTVDVKAFLDWLVNSRGYSNSLWVTRMEVGSEVDDNTSGSVSMNNVTFEVNGQSRSFEFCQ